MHNPFSTYSDTHIMHNPGLRKMCATGLMTPQELLQHLRSEGDATHTAISIYLEKLNTFS